MNGNKPLFYSQFDYKWNATVGFLPTEPNDPSFYKTHCDQNGKKKDLKLQIN